MAQQNTTVKVTASVMVVPRRFLRSVLASHLENLRKREGGIRSENLTHAARSLPSIRGREIRCSRARTWRLIANADPSDMIICRGESRHAPALGPAGLWHRRRTVIRL